MPESEPVPVKPKRDPAALSSEYHKAHKQVMLWATILFIWELVGVDLSKVEKAGGYVGPIVTALKSPQAVPWVLFALVIYFLIKCSIEWAQCHLDRRRMRFARADFVSAWIVALAAISLYAGQAVSRVQFADYFQGSNRESLWYGILPGAGFALGIQFRRFTRAHRVIFPKWFLVAVFILFSLTMLIPVISIFRHNLTWKPFVASFLVSAAFLWMITQIFWDLPWPKFAQKLFRLPKKSSSNTTS
jgi:hypothetical protein